MSSKLSGFNFWFKGISEIFRTFGGPEKIREVVFEKRKNVETRSLTRTSQITCFPPPGPRFDRDQLSAQVAERDL